MELEISRGSKIDKPNKSPSYRTALHSAAEKNHPDIIRLRIRKGVTPSAKDAYGFTPLQMAALCESLGATSALLELGAVGYSHFLRSFPYVLVDSSLALYGRPVWAAIHLLVS